MPPVGPISLPAQAYPSVHRKGMHPKVLRQPEEQAKVDSMLSDGATHREIAAEVGVGKATITRYVDANRERIEVANTKAQVIAAETFLRRVGPAIEARMDDAEVRGEKVAPQSLEVAAKVAGVIQKGGTSVHIGHNYSETNILDQSQHAYLDATDPSERREKRDALRKGLGLE